MATKRSEGQVFIGFFADTTIVGAIESERGKKEPPQSKSDYLRSAVVDHLNNRGWKISIEKKYMPDRTGKGGPKPKPQAHEKTANSAKAVDQAVARIEAEELAKLAARKPKPPGAGGHGPGGRRPK